MKRRYKAGFTLLEIVFVLVIVSILSVVAIGSYERDELGEATLQVMEHIRYTRYLAMMESKFDPAEKAYDAQEGSKINEHGKYQLSFWQIRFIKRLNSNPQVIGYSVYSDRDRLGNVDINNHTEAAVNQFDRKLIHGYGNPANQKVSPDSFLNLRYGIVDIVFSDSCQPTGYSLVANDVGVIAFDNYGRPYHGISSARSTEFALKSDCSITLVDKKGQKSTIIVKNLAVKFWL